MLPLAVPLTPPADAPGHCSCIPTAESRDVGRVAGHYEEGFLWVIFLVSNEKMEEAREDG